MGRAYFTADDQAMTASPGDSVLSYQSATTIRPAIYEFIVGTTGTPADNAIEYRLMRFDGGSEAGDALTPQPLDQAMPAALGTALGNLTTEPTAVAGEDFIIGINQRATFRWIASPGRELLIPAVADEGVNLVGFNGSYTGLYTGTMFWEE